VVTFGRRWASPIWTKAPFIWLEARHLKDLRQMYSQLMADLKGGQGGAWTTLKFYIAYTLRKIFKVNISR
jgi:hypothetical protein